MCDYLCGDNLTPLIFGFSTNPMDYHKETWSTTKCKLTKGSRQRCVGVKVSETYTVPSIQQYNNIITTSDGCGKITKKKEKKSLIISPGLCDSHSIEEIFFPQIPARCSTNEKTRQTKPIPSCLKITNKTCKKISGENDNKKRKSQQSHTCFYLYFNGQPRIKYLSRDCKTH